MHSHNTSLSSSEQDTASKSLNISDIDITSRIKYPEDRRFPVKFGGYADIYMADLDGLKVAVKVMRDVGVNEEKRLALSKKIQDEISIWSSMQHPNILPFKGFTFFPPEASDFSVFALVSPWMERGTLLEYVKPCSDGHRCIMLLEVCKGLEYLHERNIVHGDLKGCNILVTGQGRPVLADFGLSRLSEVDAVFSTKSAASSATGFQGTARYMARELFNPVPPKPTKATDIWALGCVIMVRLHSH
ncbi:kinase-like protein [Sistotremastrum niveocremeum HHB9708]|uniref:Kinase-like protein n=1 Tax=Sistotremastrum niveocremeum HHB9708 TaxID=1314777 RepID=A0A164PH26_9AGAM|nr:kinase-like protein [Sistotremastrum niveocremeum HHB9708]